MCGGKLTTGWACGSNRGVKAVVKASRRVANVRTVSLSCWMDVCVTCVDACVADCISSSKVLSSMNSGVASSGFWS